MTVRKDSETTDTARVTSNHPPGRSAATYRAANLAGPLAAACLWLVLPLGLGSLGRVGGAVVIAALAPVDWLVYKFAPASSAEFISVLHYAGVCLALAFLAPPGFPGAVVVMTTLVVGVLPTESTTRFYFMLVLGGVGFAVIGLLRNVEAWPFTVGMLVVACAATDVWHRTWRQQLEDFQRRHNEMLDRAMIFSWEVDQRTKEIATVAGNVEAVLGYTAEEFVGSRVSDIVVPDDRDQLVESYGVHDGARHGEVRAIHRDGSEVRLREVRLEDDTGSGMLRGISIDVTELSQAREALRRQAEQDALTGLVNRSVIDTFLTGALRPPTPAPVALMVADLDRFKEINDTLGHPIGDQLLQVLANRFQSSLADLDVVARIGGDEFAFAVQGDLTVEEALEIGVRIHELATSPIRVDGLALAVACSVGVAMSPEHGTTNEELMKHADIATYQCKRSGGGVLMFAPDPDELSMKRWRLLSEISGAIDRREFELFMQPKVELATGKVVGVEGLARWHHPELGLLFPGDFLHALEVAADYHRFTNEILRQGIEFAATARSATDQLNVAVNLGAMSFLDHSLPARVAAMLEMYDLPGDALTFEVIELDVLDERGDDAIVFDALGELGVRLSIDDFGTGYSSFKRLRSLSVDEVKIDRSFVAGLGVAVEDKILVETIIELCRVLDLSVVAEGVETQAQADILQGLGCGLAQGYFFARPMPQADMLAWIAAGSAEAENKA